MLTRVADSLFWMSRYIERAENTIRLVDVNLQLLMEAEALDEAGIEAYWSPILATTGDLKLFHRLYNGFSSQHVTRFLTFEKENPSSVMNCVRAARENARIVRDQISHEMWEIMNRLYLFLRSCDYDSLWKNGPLDFCSEIKEYALLFEGITESTFLHRVGYEFIKAGKYLERTDKTGRLLDIKHYMRLPEGSEEGGVVDIAQWTALLRAAGARDAYHQVYVSDVVPKNVVEFLLFNREFPRSMLFGLARLQAAIHAVSGCPTSHFSNEAERKCGRLIMDFSYLTVDELGLRGGLHRFLTEVQRQLDEIALELNRIYMFYPIVDPTAERNGSIDEADQNQTQTTS